jgi:hypothetical protein
MSVIKVALTIGALLASFGGVLIYRGSGNDPAPGYTPLPEKLTVHMVHHTHDDVGWLYTVEEYFDQRVHSILDTVVAELLADETLRFMYVEMKFLNMWWQL